MNVEQLMTRTVATCRPDDRLHTAAQIMWDGDCGCVPVVDAENRVVGMLTDRDVCMAAYIQGRRLTELRVSLAMSGSVFACRPQDSLAAAAEAMRAHQVHRLPVVDADNRLVGLLSLSDLAAEAERERRAKAKRHVADQELALTLGAVRQRRSPRDIVASH